MTQTNGRKVGRPRLDQRTLTRAPEDEILHQAAKLFSKKRFEGTSTKEIAEASGLRQSSLFHYFASKEDILVALSERASIEPLHNLRRISGGPGSPAVKLYLVTRAHVRVAIADRWSWRAVLENSHSLSWQRFRRYLTQESEYSAGLARLIIEGIDAGEFVDDPAGLTVARILGMCNWSLRWYRRAGPLDADEIACFFAAAAVRSVLVDSRRLPKIEVEAARIAAQSQP